MIDGFPLISQPAGSNSCLPTAIAAILIWNGIDADGLLASISELCEESELGCNLETAIRNIDEKYAVDDMTGDEDGIRTLLSGPEPKPVLVQIQTSLQMQLTYYHAVVLLGTEDADSEGIAADTLVFFDPASGQIERDVTGLLWQQWSLAGSHAYVIDA